MWTSAYEECPQAEYTGIALEYGTLPLPQIVMNLRAEQWMENHPEAPAEAAGGGQAALSRCLLHRHAGVEGPHR
jgi:hypothetical protein